jgi:hypothetical protein
MLPSQMRKNAFYRGQGYQQARQQTGGIGELLLVGVLLWAVTWIVPCGMVYELFTYGWAYTYNDWLPHMTTGGILFVSLCWIAAIAQIICGVKLLVH